jgi:hypothetical protein
MDEAYFNNPDLVQADLEAWAISVEKTVEDLNTGDIRSESSFTASNGEPGIRGFTYLRRAMKVLGKKSKKETLDELKNTAGIEVRKMDEAYFNNPNLVRADLEAWAASAGKTVEDLSTSDTKSKNSFTASNGEPDMNGKKYLYRAMKVLGIKGEKETLDRLKKTAGIEVNEYSETDEAYFNSPDLVRADLKAWAISVKKEVEDLSTNDARSVEIFTASNGEPDMNGNKYVNRAMKALGIEGKKETLDHLKKTAGIEVKTEYSEMDEVYFSDSDKVNADLEAWAKAARKEVWDLSTNDARSVKIFTASNGEPDMNGEKYLNRAMKVLGIKGGKETLDHLKNTAGIEVKTEYPEMDTAYFYDSQKIKADLEAWATSVGKAVEELNTGSDDISSEKSFTTSNGEPDMNGKKYLRRAMKVLGIKGVKETIDRLKQIAGFLPEDE